MELPGEVCALVVGLRAAADLASRSRKMHDRKRLGEMVDEGDCLPVDEVVVVERVAPTGERDAEVGDV